MVQQVEREIPGVSPPVILVQPFCQEASAHHVPSPLASWSQLLALKPREGLACCCAGNAGSRDALAQRHPLRHSPLYRMVTMQGAQQT